MSKFIITNTESQLDTARPFWMVCVPFSVVGDAVPEQCYAGGTFPKKYSGSAGEEQGITNWIILSSFNTWNAADSLYLIKKKNVYMMSRLRRNNKTFHSCTKWIIIIRSFWLCEFEKLNSLRIDFTGSRVNKLGRRRKGLRKKGGKRRLIIKW